MGKKIIHFTAKLDKMDGRSGWSFIEFPYIVEELFGTKGMVRVKGNMNGVAVDRALMPSKSGYHIIILGGDLRRQMKLKHVGDKVHAELWLDPEPNKLHLPEELAETLDFIPEMKAAWNKLNPGMQRSMCYWVASAKTASTKAKRIAELLRRFESGDPNFGGRKIRVDQDGKKE